MAQDVDFETDVLIIGTGPAGASAAALLATYGITNMVVNRYAWTARTPRAHITNQRTLEVLRDLGLERDALAQATPHTLMGENTYCASLAGEEFGRILTWGTHPTRKADYELASPTQICDLPQNLMEPLLLSAAAQRGAKVRFDTEYLDHEQDEKGVTTMLRDRLSGRQYRVRSRYLLGADGANSKVVDDAGLPLEGQMGVSGSMNIVFDADLSRFVSHRPSVLYWIIQPGSDVGGLGIGVVRMVRPWYRWLAIWGYDVAQGPPEVSESLARSIVHNLIGDASVPVKIDSTSTWTVNNVYAKRLSAGRVFCLGDAVHRHPPTNGLGSNVSIQDAYNLAWKLAYVIKGHASAALLDTYDTERAPVAAQTVKRANKSLEDFPPILQAMGLLDTKDPAQMKRNIAGLREATDEAAQRRSALRTAIAASDYVYNCHGVEMNQRYSSAAIVPDGTPDPGFTRDPELYHQATSRPGAHVPHVWLTHNGARVSTLDCCGKGRFAILTGKTGQAWNDIAARVGAALGLAIDVTVVGPGDEYEDPYGDFAAMMETDENGAVLVRPDLMVAWRTKKLTDTSADDLRLALAAILARA